MSHFTVAVFVEEGKDFEELLAPYQENNMGDCPEEYLEFYECDSECIEQYEEHKDEYETLDDFMWEYHEYSKDEETGLYGYWENPNAKWDWYKIGGRWSNMLITKDGTRCDYAQLKDIDWEKMKEERIKSAEATWERESGGRMSFFSGILENDTKESFVKRQSQFATYAVITPDGEWHSEGKMGWFGCGSETQEQADMWTTTFYDAFIKNADKELTLVIVDCHI